MEPIQDFWFEVFKTNEDESTETVFSSENMNKALFHSEFCSEYGIQDLKVDLWVTDGQNNIMPIPVMEVSTKTKLKDIEETLLKNEAVSTDLKDLIMKELNTQFPIGETNN